MTYEVTIEVFKIVIPLLIGAVVYIVRWGQRIETNIAEHKANNKLSFSEVTGRINKVDDLTKYLAEANNTTKEQLIAHDLIVSEIRVDLRYMKEQQNEILKLLKDK